MRVKKSGPEPNMAMWRQIIALRRKRKPITEIAKKFGVTKQAISYYIRRYGDVKPVEKSS